MTKSDIIKYDEESGKLSLKVDFTGSQKIDGLPDLGPIVRNIKVPVGALWRLLPWNKGRDATCELTVVYCDEDFRITQDIDGEYFVYARPIMDRELSANLLN